MRNATEQLINMPPRIIKHVIEQIFLENMITAFSSITRIFTLITEDDFNEKNLLHYLPSLWKNNPGEARYVTILSDILLILLILLHNGKVSGSVDSCNKGKISVNWLQQVISKQLKKEMNNMQTIDSDELIDLVKQWN